MKALVLTFDKYRPFAMHMILCYLELWPDCPFVFRIPYQSESVKKEYETKFGDKVELIKSSSGIVDTMFALSEDLEAEDWVYWCMDDRYLIKADIEKIQAIYNYINSLSASEISGVAFASSPNCWDNKHKFGKSENICTTDGLQLLRRRDYLMIWYHQFLRVKVIKTFFGLFPRVMKQAKEMDYIKDKSHLPNNQKLYFLDHNIAIFGESTNRGHITLNSIESFKKHRMPIPEEFPIIDKFLLKGTSTKIDVYKYLLKQKIKQILGYDKKKF